MHGVSLGTWGIEESQRSCTRSLLYNKSYFLLRREGKKEENDKGQGKEPFNVMAVPRTFVGKFSIPPFSWEFESEASPEGGELELLPSYSSSSPCWSLRNYCLCLLPNSLIFS